MHRPTLAALLALLLAGCAVAPEAPPAASHDPAPFSGGTPNAGMPAGWEPYRLMRLKKMTAYHIVRDEGRVALMAEADASASGMRHGVSVDLRETPYIEWEWKVPARIEGANNTLAQVEDSPARIVVAFEGSREDLPDAEQINYDLALAMTGNRLPFATIMYIWENRLPEGSIVTHHHTTRIKMIVAGSGTDNLGVWHRERHNLLEDYRRAFGGEPPRVVSVGVMSDSDNTGARAVAYFGDIRFVK